MRYKFIAVAAAMLLAGVESKAQRVEGEMGIDVVSQYIWRGQDLGHVSVQPTLGIGWKGLSLSAWGSVGLTSADTKEIDLTLGYKSGGFNIGVVDYWFNDGQDKRYFIYDADRTSHVFEANVGYDFGAMNVQWYTNFAGNDGLNNNGKRAYSSYVELSAPFTLAGCDWNATLGVVPYATDYYDTSGFAITNISVQATKEIVAMDKLTIPLFAGIIVNPCLQKTYLTVGFSIIPKL